jgi:hypothetical protein
MKKARVSIVDDLPFMRNAVRLERIVSAMLKSLKSVV